LEQSLKQLIKNRQNIKELEELKQQLTNTTKELDSLKRNLASQSTFGKTDSKRRYNTEVDKLLVADFFLEGKKMLEARDYERAIEAFSNALKINPKMAACYRARGQAKANLGSDNSAIDDYTMAISLEPRWGWTYALRAKSEENLSDHQNAISDYTLAIEKNPSNVFAYTGRARVKAHKKDYKGSLADFTKSIAIASSPESYFYRATVRFRMKDYKAAVKDATNAIELSNQFAEAYYLRALANIGLRHKDKGCVDLTTANKLGNAEAKQDIERYCK
jgi:tetratricopeptide (TPR) repeat protein